MGISIPTCSTEQFHTPTRQDDSQELQWFGNSVVGLSHKKKTRWVEGYSLSQYCICASIMKLGSLFGCTRLSLELLVRIEKIFSVLDSPFTEEGYRPYKQHHAMILRNETANQNTQNRKSITTSNILPINNLSNPWLVDFIRYLKKKN